LIIIALVQFSLIEARTSRLLIEFSIKYQEELEKVKNQLATKNQKKMYVKITSHQQALSGI
jgi:hypothetical protein